MSSNKFQNNERMKEMSKQEEILLRRKREIEKKLKKEQSSERKATKEKPDKKSSLSSSTLFPSQSLPFANDGSFMEQFKKLADQNKSIEKEEIKSEIISNKTQPTSSRKTLFNFQIINPNVKKVKQEKEIQEQIYSEVKPSNQPMQVQEESTNTTDSNISEPEPEWFKDALRRAQNKAKELANSNSTNVSLSAPPCGPSDAKKKSGWNLQMTEAPVPAIPTATAPIIGVNPQTGFSVPLNIMNMVGVGQHVEAIKGVMISRLTRNNPAIISYARNVFGSLDLSDSQWKQCEEQMKMNIVFQLLEARNRETEELEQAGKFKYEYDSDEDTVGGTWEHKRRKVEMETTSLKAEELTKNADGKHHIGDFLPPEELMKFMEKYTAMKEGRDPDFSDYRENKLTVANIGYKMLQSMGWTEGMGLGAEGKGITTPVNQAARSSENQGLGVAQPDILDMTDDEYDAYRKRMMLAYRFRPNPLNNPRRAYY